ncbi:two-component system sensor histidine kinase NtrB [Lentisalinibacter sediminis]|uniref:two-component system sensor histidine kinase NtrB n=1 Tax=Lentisalinibacter sediminis TaxID=2992237 RepID=UPI0038650377
MNRPATDDTHDHDSADSGGGDDGRPAEAGAQRALREAEERWQRLYDNVPAGLFELDARGHITRMNPAVRAMLGDADPAALQRRLAQGRVFRHRHQLLAWLRALTRGETVRGMELALAHVDGGAVHVMAACAPVRDARGMLSGYEGMFTDITEMKALQQQFVLAQKMEAVGQLTGGIAHDFNNLLSIINGNLYLAEQELGAGHPLAALLAATRKASRQGADLTRSLLAFARRETPEPERIDLDERIGALRPLLERALESGIELRICPAGRPAPVWLDAAGFESALLNLAINARDAMPEGGVFSLAVEADGNVTGDGSSDRPPGWLVTVADTGTGMSEEVCRRALEPFFTTKPEGSGLGLAMVQRFAGAAGGRLALDSRPGEGTTFRLWLPAAD